MKKHEEIVKIWKENKVSNVIFKFSCGGDSMNDTEIIIEDKNGNSGISCSELSSYFEDEVYKNVSFYENSDGHYQGESGEVFIEYNEEDDIFVYSKSSQSEWSETHTDTLEIELSKKQVQFIKEKIRNINGGNGDSVVNYKGDLILSDEDEDILKGIVEELDKLAREHYPEIEGELQEDWYRFTTNEDSEEIVIENNKMKVKVDTSITVYTDGDN